MTKRDRSTVEGVLAAFDEHLRRVRGVCPGTRRNYARYVDEFLVMKFADRGVEFGEVRAPEVAAFVGGLSGRYRPRTVEHAATALRVFFRFLRAQGWCEDRLADAVPMVPHRPSGLVRHLDPRVLEQLIASLQTASARDLRDRAIILAIARVGLRPGEVAKLRLEDIDWRNAAIRPLPPKEMGSALGVAVLLDAYLVRLVVLPVLLRLTGKAVWWAPRRLPASDSTSVSSTAEPPNHLWSHGYVPEASRTAVPLASTVKFQAEEYPMPTSSVSEQECQEDAPCRAAD